MASHRMALGLQFGRWGSPAYTLSPHDRPSIRKSKVIVENKMSELEKKPPTEDDLDDLDDLLDDFANDVLSKPPGGTTASVANTTSGDGSGEPDQPLKNEIDQGIEELIKDLKIEDPETKAQFETLVKQFEEDRKDELKDPKKFENVMEEAMQRLRDSGKNIDEQIKNDQSSSNPEDVLTQMLAGLGGGDGDMDMSKMLVDMLEQLSSKEVLYEPIKDLNTKFPDYLKEKKGVITDAEYDNYSKQYEITTSIVTIFENANYSDEDKVKRDEVNSLLEKLQELGQPPTELVGDASTFPGFGGGLGGDGVPGGLDFNDKDLPPDLEKQLEEGCKQT